MIDVIFITFVVLCGVLLAFPALSFIFGWGRKP
jgi:hypothetical protein